MDYGTANPCSFGLWGLREGVWYRMEEYYYASRRTGVQLTDQEYVAAMDRPVFQCNFHSFLSFFWSSCRET